MIEIRQTETFRIWEAKLRDRRARTIIAARVARLAAGLPGDVAPVGEGVSELRIHHARATGSTFNTAATRLLCCCVAGIRQPSLAILPKRKSWLKNGANEVAEKLTTYDPAVALVNDEEIAFFMADALETGDAAFIAQALGIVARAKGMAQIADQTGLSREQLYRSFSANGNPTLKTTLAVMKALGVELTAKVASAA
jgi:probable addiction module antidote protein/putative addiction module killer protein